MSVVEGSNPAIAAAAGWLAGRALRILSSREFLDRVTTALTSQPPKLTLEFLTSLETDIRLACHHANLRAPTIQEFFTESQLRPDCFTLK